MVFLNLRTHQENQILDFFFKIIRVILGRVLFSPFKHLFAYEINCLASALKLTFHDMPAKQSYTIRQIRLHTLYMLP